MGNTSYGWFNYSSEDKPPTSFQCTQKAHVIIILSSRVYEGIPNLNSKIYCYFLNIPLMSKQHNIHFMSNGHFRLTFTVHLIFNSLYVLLSIIIFGCWSPECSDKAFDCLWKKCIVQSWNSRWHRLMGINVTDDIHSIKWLGTSWLVHAAYAANELAALHLNGWLASTWAFAAPPSPAPPV